MTILFLSGRKTDGINIAIIAVTSSALMFGLKEFFHRKRPDLPLIRTLDNFSFPSGHALSSFIFCSVLVYLVWKGETAQDLEMDIIGATHFIFDLYWHQPDSVALSLCIGCDRRFCLALAWVIFRSGSKKIDIKKNRVAVGYLTCPKIFSCSFARLVP